LEELQTERSKTIDKLKAATKYNKTQQLLEQYGGASSPKPKRSTSPAQTAKKTQKQPQRTSLGPPATANIPSRNQITSSPPPVLQQLPPSAFVNRPPPSIPSSPVSHSDPGPPEFAPNAFAVAPQYDRSNESNAEGKWYDRILDLLMGEDETAPRNRIVLICQHCRLVNGQAPPGVKRLEELGKWRCSACHRWNGEVLESEKIVEEIKEMVQMEGNSQSGAIEDKKGVESLSEEDMKDLDDKALEDEDYEEIDEGVHAEEEPTKRTRRGRKRVAGDAKS
jgi:endoplasmic reticulum junction formation protein lunapark